MLVNLADKRQVSRRKWIEIFSVAIFYALKFTKKKN